jgi:hypothetical protein
MKLLILIVFLHCTHFCFAQTHELGFLLNAGVARYSFTRDPLVSERRSGKLATGSMTELGLEYTYTHKKGFFFKSGIGLSNHFMTIKGGSAFRILFPREQYWYVINNSDSFNLLRTEHNLRTISIPTSIGYSFLIGKNIKSTLDLGIECQHHFLGKAFIRVTADTAFRIPDNSDLEWIEKRFNDRASRYMISIRPIIDFNIFISERFKIKIGAAPIEKYLTAWYKNINTPPSVVQFRMGAQLKL